MKKAYSPVLFRLFLCSSLRSEFSTDYDPTGMLPSRHFNLGTCCSWISSADVLQTRREPILIWPADRGDG
jgi:hypothetical protein